MSVELQQSLLIHKNECPDCDTTALAFGSWLALCDNVQPGFGRPTNEVPTNPNACACHPRLSTMGNRGHWMFDNGGNLQPHDFLVWRIGADAYCLLGSVPRTTRNETDTVSTLCIACTHTLAACLLFPPVIWRITYFCFCHAQGCESLVFFVYDNCDVSTTEKCSNNISNAFDNGLLIFVTMQIVAIVLSILGTVCTSIEKYFMFSRRASVCRTASVQLLGLCNDFVSIGLV